jgi:hypothetical protein
MVMNSKIVAQHNPYNGTWEVGWLHEDGVFTPGFCGYASKEEAEAEIPSFDAKMDKQLEDWMREQDEIEREQDKEWPNIAYVRQKIRAMRDPLKAIDANDKLLALLAMDLHEHIGWPLPSWKAIERRDV